MASKALIIIFVLKITEAIASQGPEKLKVTLNGEVKERWEKSEGTYILAPNLLNDKPYWLKEAGLQAIWYDKVFKNWKIGDQSDLGTTTSRLLTTKGTADTGLPHEVTPWKYLVNGAWTASTDIVIDEEDIYANCDEAGINCIVQNKGNGRGPGRGSDDCRAEKNCRVVSTFQKLDDGRIKFELQAEFENAGNGDHWTGIGLSLNDTWSKMGNDSVVACYGTNVVNYWNTLSFSFKLEDSSYGLSDTSISIKDGKIYCSFIRDAVTNLILPNDLGEATIDLDNIPYFVMLASGPLATSTQIDRHRGASVTKTFVKLSQYDSNIIEI